MRILFLTQYYPPETGAPQNRIHSLACYLKADGVEVEVLTALPNYPRMEIFPDYVGKEGMNEYIDGIKVYRAGIYIRRSKGIFKRLLNYFSFVYSSMQLSSKLPEYDFVICESPPLFLGISAYLIAKRKNAKMIFNVSDLWPESAEKLNIVTNKWMLKLAYRLEAFLYKKSILVTGQTQGIVKNIAGRFPNVRTYWLPNGVDFKMFSKDKINKEWRTQKGFANDAFILLYAGILGHAQGLEVILNAADRLRSYSAIKFIIMGDGPEKDALLQMKNDMALENVIFEPNTPRHLMPSVISSIDAAVIPLKKLDIFLGAIPSKVFEPLAYGKPIILGVGGEAKELFIDSGDAGLYFEPENATALAQAVLMLYQNPATTRTLGQNGAQYVKDNFDRKKISSNLYNVLQSL
ncbi:MAG: glycosyltransferase family 4 protein [Taibaiella sp.]|nr:glycosyltransferase family 4 protein [Taibaiella sp.]